MNFFPFPAQFEDNMVNICMKILDLNHKHTQDPAGDVAARCDPIYISRVLSAMVGRAPRSSATKRFNTESHCS